MSLLPKCTCGYSGTCNLKHDGCMQRIVAEGLTPIINNNNMSVTKRQRRLAAQKMLKQPESKFEQIDLSTANFVPKGMTMAFRNNRYTVMIYTNAKTTHGTATQVLIQNHTDTPIINHWAEIQRIKNELFGSEVTAIEYFPAESELIDLHNIYWIFIFPDGVIPKLSTPSPL